MQAFFNIILIFDSTFSLVYSNCSR